MITAAILTLLTLAAFIFRAIRKRVNSYSITTEQLAHKQHAQQLAQAPKPEPITILTERPPNMIQDEYRARLREQKEAIRKHRSGQLCYTSSELVTAVHDEKNRTLNRQTYQPFKGDTHKLNPL